MSNNIPRPSKARHKDGQFASPRVPVDSVTGQRVKGARNRAQLFDLEATSRGYPEAPDWSAGVPHARKSHDNVVAGNAALNHILGCPACAAGMCHD